MQAPRATDANAGFRIFSIGGSVTALTVELEKQLTARLRERGLVFWLDRDNLYSRFVDGLRQRHGAGRFFAPVVGFRGSFLETLLALEPYQAGLDPEPLLVHLPGHTDVTVRNTPLLEAYRTGTRFERALDTLVREVAAGRVSPEQTESFLSQGKRTLEEAEKWLDALDDRDRIGLAATLDAMGPECVLERLVEAPSDLTRQVESPKDRESVRAFLARHTGLSSEFTAFFLENGPDTLRSLTEAWVGWLLCVEYVNDLTRPPTLDELKKLTSLSTPLRKKCLELTEHLRKRLPDAYRALALATEARLEAELNSGKPEELGKVDTFSREDTRLLEGAVLALQEERWRQALDWANTRLDSPSVWLQKDLWRRQEWSLVRDAASLGQTVVDCRQPLASARSLEDALETYTQPAGPQKADRAHRHFEQERLQHLSPQLPHFQGLERSATLVRSRYREWLDDLTAAFSDLCAREGYLPPPPLQQRHLYEQVVHPLTQGAEAQVAFFMVDALRYEMAVELAERLDGQVHLKARYSELPSITSVGMNVLAPVCRDGHLTLDNKPFSGFRAGEYSVKKREHRVRAMGDRSLERHSGTRRTPLLLSLAEVGNTPPDKLARQVKAATLIVVHSRDIDAGGEADVGLATFDRCLGLLRSAVQHLRNAGVEEFVLTSDHGFMLLDPAREPYVYNGGEVDRRFILTDSPVRAEAVASVPLRSLNYGGAEGYLMFLRDSRTFKSAGSTAATFAHGGNSLQERVIPVLSVSYRKPKMRNLASYQIEARVLSPIVGFCRIALTLRDVSEGVLQFEEPPPVSLALRVADSASAQALLEDAPGATLVNQQLQVRVGQEVEVLFKLVGGSSERAAVELYHPDGTEQVETLRLPGFFSVTGALPAPAPQVLSWVEHFEDQSVVRVFRHVESYGSVEESELLEMLGGARQVRRFALRFEEYVRLLPFLVRVETIGSGKRYVKGA